MATTPRLSQNDLLTTCPEPQYRASQEIANRALAVEGMSTTTFTNASVTAGLVGCWAVPTDGVCRGAVRQVISVAGTTATVDAAWNATTSVTSVRFWTPADLPIVADSGTTITAVDAAHQSIAAEPDDFWNGHFILWKAGANAGTCSLITDFTSSTGQFQFAAITAVDAGDLGYIRQLVRPEAVPATTLDPTVVERVLVGNADGDAPLIGSNRGTVNLDLPVKGLSASAGNATAAVAPRDASSMLSDHFTQTLDTGSTVSAVAANQITVASGTGYTIGSFVLPGNGQAAQIVNKATNVLTLGTGQCTTTAGIAVGSNLYASAHYKRKAPMGATEYTRTFDFWRGGKLRQVYAGCSPTFQMSITRDAVVRYSLGYTAGEAFQYEVDRPISTTTTAPITLYDTTIPYDAKCSRFLLDEVAVLVRDITIDGKFTPTIRQSLSGLCASDGTFVQAGQMTVAMNILADEDDKAGFKDIVDRIQGNDVISLFYQKGNAAKETFCWAAPACVLSKVTFAYQDNTGEFGCTLNVMCPQAAPDNTFAATLPAFSFGYL